MKALKTIIAVIFIGISMSAFAINEKARGEKLSMDYTVQTYIEAFTEGKVKALGEVLDNNVKFTVTQGEKILSFNRNQMLNVLKESENVKQNCSTTYTVVEQGANQSIVKVVMDYQSFTKVNYVTIAQTSDGWKITNVSSVFN